MFEVIKPGLETSVQDLPGRIGYWEQGFPPSGPVDIWSFRLANLLVGNNRDAAALECQFLDRRYGLNATRSSRSPAPTWARCLTVRSRRYGRRCR